MIPLTRDLGAVIRWFLRGCKTRLKDEFNGEVESLWLKKLSPDTESYFLGLAFVGLLLCLIITFGFLFPNFEGF